MTTTLTLVDTVKIDTRKNGDISYIKCTVVIDGAPTEADFRCRVGDEPILVDSDTITVSDAQADLVRARIAHVSATRADMAARDEAKMQEALGRLDARLDERSASDAEREELHALYRAYPRVVDMSALGRVEADVAAFNRKRAEIVARYASAA